MGFWGIEIEPGDTFTHRFDKAQGKLHITQATLGTGREMDMSAVQCSVGGKDPIFICGFSPYKCRACPLNLEFEEEDDVVFSVVGPLSVHLTGFFRGSCLSKDEVQHFTPLATQKTIQNGGDQRTWTERISDSIVQTAVAEKRVVDVDHVANEDHSEVNRSKKSKCEESNKNANEEDDEPEVIILEIEDKKAEAESSKALTLANGISTKEDERRIPNGMKATPGTNIDIS